METRMTELRWNKTLAASLTYILWKNVQSTTQVYVQKRHQPSQRGLLTTVMSRLDLETGPDRFLAISYRGVRA